MSSSFLEQPEAAELVEPEELRRWGDVRVAELIAILLAIVLADATIYRGHGYTGLAALFVGTLGLLYLGKRWRWSSPPLWIVGGMLVILAAHLVWYGSLLQVVVGAVLTLSFATALDGQSPFLLNVLTMGSQVVVAGIRALGEYATALRRSGPRLHRLRMLSIILPVLAFLVFTALFVLANPDAVRFVGRQFEAFVNEVSEWLVRMALTPTEPLFWIGVALVMAGLLRPVVRLSSEVLFPATVEPREPAKAPLYAALRNTLATVIGLFAIYLAYEFLTFWTRDFPAGFYYSGYAHEGAAWLTVALALATLILSGVFSGPILGDPRLPKLRWLAWVWSIENLLLSLSVYNRLFIYIDFNGMTRMRIVGLFGISVVVVGFLLVVWKIARGNSFAWLIHRQLWALGVAIYLFAITPVDGIATHYNVRRILDGDVSASMQIGVHPLDLEGMMALPPLLDAPTPEIREGVAALIAECYQQLQAARQKRQQAGWTAYQLSDEIALERFEAVREQWVQYEDVAKREAAIKRLYVFAYQWY